MQHFKRPLHHDLHPAQGNETLRHWQANGAYNHHPADFILPIFVHPDDNIRESIDSMPGVFRYGIKQLINYLTVLINNSDLKTILLFPVMKVKGLSHATDPQYNPALRAIPELKQTFPRLNIITDVCLCGFSEDGHCCVFNESKMDNEASIKLIGEIAVAYAKAGADVIAPSDMMDGRVAEIRSQLNENKLNHVSIMSYSAKFASCFYGPFRDAAGSAPSFGDRKCYQLPPGATGLAMRAVARDIQEGADTVMVKPALNYLDLVKEISIRHPHHPIAVYHVSGEFAKLYHAAANGAFDLETAVMEDITSFKRAGAKLIITYFTPLILEILQRK